mgnify:CR=1 FL=1
MIWLRKDQIEPPPDIGIGRIQEYITGVGKVDRSLVILIHIEKILTEEEILKLEDVKKVRTTLEATEKVKAPSRGKTPSPEAAGGKKAGTAGIDPDGSSPGEAKDPTGQKKEAANPSASGKKQESRKRKDRKAASADGKKAGSHGAGPGTSRPENRNSIKG